MVAIIPQVISKIFASIQLVNILLNLFLKLRMISVFTTLTQMMEGKQLMPRMSQEVSPLEKQQKAPIMDRQHTLLT